MIPRLLLAVLLTWLLATAPAAVDAAERWVLPGLGEGQLTAADLDRGRAILVVWASWSPRCRDIVPRVNALTGKWSSQARVATVVFQEEADDVRAFLAGQTLVAPVYLDQSGSFAKKHAVTTLPSLLIFEDGEASFRGKLPVNPDPVIERALGSPSS